MPIPTLLASVLTMKFSPSCRYCVICVVKSDSFRDEKAVATSGDHWSVCVSSVSRVNGFAMSANSGMSLL
jgi:hypothetical protein